MKPKVRVGNYGILWFQKRLFIDLKLKKSMSKFKVDFLVKERNLFGKDMLFLL